MPKLSIIIPAYNSSAYIQQTLESVELLREGSSEIVIVDDGSRDDTVVIIENYIRIHKQDNLLLLKQNNRGVSSARNFGLQNSTGDFVIFIDSDDIVNAEGIENILKVAEGKDICYGQFSYLVGSKVVAGPNNKIKPGKVGSFEFLREFMIGKENISICCCILCRDFLEQESLTFRDGYAYGEDQEFLLRAMNRAHYIEKVNTIVFRYRIHQGSAMAKRTEMQMDAIRVFLETQFEKEVPIELASIYSTYYLPRVAIGIFIKISDANKFKKNNPSQFAFLLKILRAYSISSFRCPKDIGYYLVTHSSFWRRLYLRLRKYFSIGN